MGWLPFSKSKEFDPSEFEKQLATLAARISSSERNINKYSYQKKRLRNIFIGYGSLLSVSITLYLLVINRFKLHRFGWYYYSLIIIFPIVVVGLHKAIIALYNIRISREEASIETWRQEHSGKIEELKEKTKFSSTQALLQRFSDGTDLNALVDEELLEKQRQLEAIKASLEPGNKEIFKAYPSSNSPRGWIESIVDAVVGSNELKADNRYALICQNCFSHNGLAPPNVSPNEVKYLCPFCGFMNNNNTTETGKQEEDHEPIESTSKND